MDKNNDYLCPICFEFLQEAYMTRCGHTFCHACMNSYLKVTQFVWNEEELSYL